jgi:hypothetical protein
MEQQLKEEEKLSPTLTEEEIKFYEQKAQEIARRLSISKVHPVVTIDAGTLKRRVCYLKEPSYDTKIRVMDKAAQIGIWSAGEELRKASVVTDESDPITYGDTYECEPYKITCVDECMKTVKRMQNQFGKKNNEI